MALLNAGHPVLSLVGGLADDDAWLHANMQDALG